LYLKAFYIKKTFKLFFILTLKNNTILFDLWKDLLSLSNKNINMNQYEYDLNDDDKKNNKIQL